MNMNLTRTLALATVGAGLILGTPSLTTMAVAMELGLDQYAGGASIKFADPVAAVAAFKTVLASNDLGGLAKLLGLNADKLSEAEGITDRFAEIRAAAAKMVTIEGNGDRRILVLGDKVWPFPFPILKDEGGNWSFNTKTGLEEILNRRIGENENQAIDTMRAYIDAQRDYASIDHDGDGVLEYAQKLISTPGQTDGLYWPIEQGDGESPAGAFVDQAQLDKAKNDKGYFGYHFRILRAQGNQVAGGRYHYVINGNMIAGFGLIAWPVEYARTGVHTFVVNQSGIVYEADLGPDTTAIVDQIRRFNPGPDWKIAGD